MNAQQDSFSEFRINNKQNQFKEIESVPESNEDQFSEFRIKKVEGFPFLREGSRHVARTASRIAETIGGIPGDITDLLQSGIFAGIEKLTGKKVSEEARAKSKKERYPTSHELKKKSQEITGGYTSPQNETERFIDESVETISSLLGPMKFRKALGVGLAATTAKKGIEKLGIGESGQEASKLGTMFLLSAINPKGAMKYASSQYDKAQELSRGASINAHHFQGNLLNLIDDLKKGISTPGKNAIIKPAEELIDKVKGGKIPVHDLTAAKRDIHSLMGDPALLKREKILLKNLGKEVDLAIRPYEKINPSFKKSYRPANEIYGAVMEGNKASNFVRKTLGNKSVLGVVLAETVLGHPEFILPTTAVAGGIHALAASSDFFSRLLKSPELRKYYGKALLSAAKEDAPTLRLYSDKIEKILQERTQNSGESSLSK